MKVLLIHASLGWGHKRAAAAVQDVLQEQGVESELVDLLDYLPYPLNRFYPWSYSFMVTRARWMWRWFYNFNDHGGPYEPAKSTLQSWQFERLRAHIEAQNYTHMISTHFTAGALLLDWRVQHGWKQRIFSVVTDYISHRCWKRNGLDHYFVATDEVKSQMDSAGIAPITVTGIPISSVFSKPLSRETCRDSWGCKPEEKLVLVLSSGLNQKKTKSMIQDLRDVPGNIRYLVSAGKDAPREQMVKKYCGGDPRFTIFGFSTRIAEMMKAADVLISKPGGLTVSESLAFGLPQILFSPIPGQEEANADYVVQKGAGVRIEAERGAFREALNGILSKPGELSEMSRKAALLAKPDAARRIVEIVTKSS